MRGASGTRGGFAMLFGGICILAIAKISEAIGADDYSRACFYMVVVHGAGFLLKETVQR